MQVKQNLLTKEIKSNQFFFSCEMQNLFLNCKVRKERDQVDI